MCEGLGGCVILRSSGTGTMGEVVELYDECCSISTTEWE